MSLKSGGYKQYKGKKEEIMVLKYEVVKEFSELITQARQEIRSSKNSKPITLSLDKVIEKLDELIDTDSKLADYTELKSDMEWLNEYYEEQSWNDVTRWLTNIDSTLRETFSMYMDELKKSKEKFNSTKHSKEYKTKQYEENKS